MREIIVFYPVLLIRLFQENGSLSIFPEDLILYYFLSVLKISKTLVFFLRTPGKYSKRYGQGSVFATDPCPYLVNEYSLDDLKKKTKGLDKKFYKK